MAQVDEMEELRAELRHAHLTRAERRSAQARLAALAKCRDSCGRGDAADECDHSSTDAGEHGA